MRITDVRLSVLKQPKGRVRAIATLIIDEEMMIHDIMVVEGDHGPFVSFPSRQGSDGEYRATVQFLSMKLHQEVQQLILRVYHDECSRPEVRNDS